MLRRMITLLIATRNEHKTGEIRAILGDRFHCATLRDFPGAPEVVEDQSGFAGNAAKKSRELAEWLGRTQAAWLAKHAPVYVLADDSGLEVDALDGAPGVHSARFAALDTGTSGNSPTAENNAKLLRLLDQIPNERRTARFHCVIALTPAPFPGGPPELFVGTCEGRIGRAHQGAGGFGYDPLFTPAGFDRTFAELGEAVKNGLSHRGRALEKMRSWLQDGSV